MIMPPNKILEIIINKKCTIPPNIFQNQSYNMIYKRHMLRIIGLRLWKKEKTEYFKYHSMCRCVVACIF